jgi:hypothetical protein
MHEHLRDAPKPEQASHADKEFTPMSSRPICLLRLPQVIDATGLGKQDKVWRRAPDGRIVIDLLGYQKWVEGG